MFLSISAGSASCAKMNGVLVLEDRDCLDKIEH